MIPKFKRPNAFDPLSETEADKQSVLGQQNPDDIRSQAIDMLRQQYAQQKDVIADKQDPALMQLMKKSRFLSPAQIAAMLRGQGGTV